MEAVFVNLQTHKTSHGTFESPDRIAGAKPGSVPHQPAAGPSGSLLSGRAVACGHAGHDTAPLLPRVAAGDALAARECVTRYAPLVLRLARRFSRSPAELEDASQDIFLELFRCAGRYREETAPEAAFVTMLARRRLIDSYRQRKPEVFGLDPEAFGAVTQDSAGEERADANAATLALQRLRPVQQQAVYLAAIRGLPHREVAEEMHLPLGTVKSHIRRGLAAVREALECVARPLPVG
jgi:RNA polymerase sigma-70 factor, ECF subfamily